MKPDNLGGGEILKILTNKHRENSNLDENLMLMFKFVPIVKILVYVVLVLLMLYVIMRMFNISTPFKGKGIKSEMGHINEVKKRDAGILRANKFMRRVTNIIGRTPLAMESNTKDYWQYNITRAGLKIPGGFRNMRAEEFHALVQFGLILSILVSLLIMILLNSVLGWVLIMFSIVIANTAPMMYVRQIVKGKDLEIKTHFADFYLMIHYVLIANANTPLSGIMKSYAKTTNSTEMHKFIDVCVHHIDTFGEYEATRKIARDYRELPEVGKLMRLIRQANEGGEIEAELMGFRAELINEKQYAMSKRREKLVGRAKASFNILMIVLVQAILSAMSIYITDLGIAKGFMG